MHSQSINAFRHSHRFLGEAHERNERRTWAVIAICTAMMIAEIVGGLWFGSVALIADGLHMSTHAGALLIAALAYTFSRRYVNDTRLTFGTGKFGDLAAFTSAIVLAMIALLIGYESVDRLITPISASKTLDGPTESLGDKSTVRVWVERQECGLHLFLNGFWLFGRDRRVHGTKS